MICKQPHPRKEPVKPGTSVEDVEGRNLHVDDCVELLNKIILKWMMLFLNTSIKLFIINQRQYISNSSNGTNCSFSPVFQAIID